MSDSSLPSIDSESSGEKYRMAAGELPQLTVNLREKKRSIAITWTILFLLTCGSVEFFYFVLRYGAKSSISTALTVPLIILAVFSIATIGYRTFLVCRKNSRCRPIGASWWMGDYFLWNIIIGFILITAVLASATGEVPPNIRQSSMPQSIVLFLASSQVLLTGVMSHFGWNSPVRLSSSSRGSPTRPGVFVLMEDVVAVDGGEGQDFRRALIARYDASPIFRRHIAHVNWFWGLGSFATAVGVTVIVFVVRDLNVVFALGWCLPWIWAVAATVITIVWSQKVLRREQIEWESPERRMSP